MKRTFSILCWALAAWIAPACCLAGDGKEDPVGKAAALARSGKVQQAEAMLRDAVTTDPASAELHGALGKLLFTEQKYPEAIQELNKAANIVPGSREYNMLLAGALLGAKRFGVAEKFLLGLQPQFDEDPEFHYSLGLAYYNLLQFIKAKAEFTETLRLDPKFEQAEFLIATSLASEGDLEKSADILRGLTEAHPANAIYWTTFGELLGKTGNNGAEALRACRKAIQLAPNDPHTEFVTATILLGASQFSEARPLFESLERRYPTQLEAHVALAKIYGRLGEPAMARKESETVKRLQDTLIQAHPSAEDGAAIDSSKKQ